MTKPRAKRDWEVTLFIEETEGDVQQVTNPWYTKEDIRAKINDALRAVPIGGMGYKMLDLKVTSIHVDPPSDPYFAGEYTQEVPF